MAFFDPKEDVIDIQLTSYGKYLVSKGKFRPIYYSFLDDEVIYDYEYCGVTESCGVAQTRIKENLRTECQSTFNGVETNIKKVNKLIRSNKILFEEGERMYQTLDNSYAFPASLGNSKLSTEYAPSWNVVYFNGEISGSIEYLSGSSQLLRIPRISSSINYDVSIGKMDPPSMENDTSVRPQDVGINKVYPDGTYIDVEDDYILIGIDEENTIFTNENFQIELFEMNFNNDGRISGSWTELIPLRFLKKDKNIPLEERSLSDELNVDSRFVEYFFDILVDEEIDKNIFCDAVKKNESKKNLFVNKMPFKCDDVITENENTFDLPDDGEEICD